MRDQAALVLEDIGERQGNFGTVVPRISHDTFAYERVVLSQRIRNIVRASRNGREETLDSGLDCIVALHRWRGAETKDRLISQKAQKSFRISGINRLEKIIKAGMH